MQVLDTNVLARWLLNDDPAQFLLADGAASEPFMLSWTVFTELGWVLERAVGLPRAVVAMLLEQLISLDHAHAESPAAVAWAIERYRAGADWADMMHLASAPFDARGFTTFEKKLARQAGDDSPLPVTLLRNAP
ncbi:type II toxin-antitoxin system VapC family toxin [Blastomonas sp.]|uniref:type II toxin-antitoxin system VapC family toxin n=1 Tax=Blastomonas sp. TaxID=1909299 RepID=UPI003592F0B4